MPLSRPPTTRAEATLIASQLIAKERETSMALLSSARSNRVKWVAGFVVIGLIGAFGMLRYNKHRSAEAALKARAAHQAEAAAAGEAPKPATAKAKAKAAGAAAPKKKAKH